MSELDNLIERIDYYCKEQKIKKDKEKKMY